MQTLDKMIEWIKSLYPAAKTSEVLPAWYEIAIKEIGVKEIPGDKHNPRIIEYHQATELKASLDEISWCAAFVNWCLNQAGVKGTNKANARSFSSWGIPAFNGPKKGDVCVFWREKPTSWKGHVGFYVGETSEHYIILGGNQGNEVCIREYPKFQLIDIRRVPDLTKGKV